jgi:hypothetical protein
MIEPRRLIVRHELLRMRHAAPGAYSVRLFLACGHELVRKASAYRGKTAKCWQCPRVSQERA